MTKTEKARIMAEMTQIEYANELLRAALDVMQSSTVGPYVRSVRTGTTKANGGGDGTCIMEEIADYFENYKVPREPQFPEIED